MSPSQAGGSIKQNIPVGVEIPFKNLYKDFDGIIFSSGLNDQVQPETAGVGVLAKVWQGTINTGI